MNFNKWTNVLNRPDVVELRNLILNSFKNLQFIEESHQYFLNGKELKSVSKIVESFVPLEDWDLKAEECSIKYWDNPDSKYYQKTKEQILKEWDENNKNACDLGHLKHDFGERIFYYYTGQYDKTGYEPWTVDPGDYMNWNITKFWNDLPVEYIPILCETRVYDESKGFSGTFDLLFAWDNGKTKLKDNLIIMDYKTNKDLFKNFKGQTMLQPFDDMLNTPISTYNIQLSMYQIPLENIGCKIIDRRLIWLNNQQKYEMYRLEDYTKILRNIL
jgi:hypothetical protein